ncbi:hypothetical protein FRC06_000083 [Ceratobasidium sp. 370]|nr:hypothetical protein FRC06_000083 [Ceratobasidium sp. 370]
MTPYTLSKTSPINTTLADPGGTVVYEVSFSLSPDFTNKWVYTLLEKVTTPFGIYDRETTIKKRGETIATIQWKVFGKDTLTMDGGTSPIKEVLPRPRVFSTSRVYTCADGQQFKWKDSKKLYCVSEDTGLNLATYYRNPFYLLSSRKSTLDISSSGTPFADILVVTWVIMEKKARDRRRAARRGGGGGGGGGDGG